MALPKVITHPLILLSVFGALFALLRLGSVSTSDVRQLWKITDYHQGRIRLAGQEGEFVLDDARLSTQSDVTNDELRQFFLGKHLKIAKFPDDGLISLPFEIYEGACQESLQVSELSACRPLRISP